MSKQVTRSSVNHSIFGSPLERLPTSELPTRLQVAKYILFIKERKNASNTDVIPQVAESVIDLWQRAGIPCQPVKNVKTKLQRLMQDGSEAAKAKGSALSGKKRNFVEGLNRLFDIAGCQCEDLNVCTCDRNIKVPIREQEFLIDQRTIRQMTIGSVDRKVTEMIKRRKVREDRLHDREEQERIRSSESSLLSATPHSSSSKCDLNLELSDSDKSNDTHDDDSAHSDFNFDPNDIGTNYNKSEVERCSNQDNRNVIPIPTIAMEADRYGVSNRAAAAISTATLVDYGIISSDDTANVIDHHKIWRARQKLRCNMKEARTSGDGTISALFFDGKKDKTLVKEKKDGRWYSESKVEDHYVLVGEPGTLYLSHITVESGTAVVIADALHGAIEEMGFTQSIMAVGADSTPVNTGHQGGVIRRLECKFNRPLQWLICSLHLNELPLRHLCKHLLGQTEGPTIWKGAIGKALTTCETMPVSATGFKSISDGDSLPEIDVKNLSRDQVYLYRIVTAIRTGVISDDLLRQKPGVMSMARWVTTASRICRLYIATEQPSSELIHLTYFVVTNYAPMWFKIKYQSSCVYGPLHLLQQLKLQTLLTPDIRDVIWRTIQRNVYWAHQENVLLAMLAHDDQGIRKIAVSIVKRIRHNTAPATNQQQVREFRPPLIKESSVSLTDLLPPDTECTFEPPLTMEMSDEELDKIVDEHFATNIPCHSQGVERCVKMVSEASKAVYGMDARDGYIRAVLKSRRLMPSFTSKQDYSAAGNDSE